MAGGRAAHIPRTRTMGGGVLACLVLPCVPACPSPSTSLQPGAWLLLGWHCPQTALTWPLLSSLTFPGGCAGRLRMLPGRTHWQTPGPPTNERITPWLVAEPHPLVSGSRVLGQLADSCADCSLSEPRHKARHKGHERLFQYVGQLSPTRQVGQKQVKRMSE